MKLDNAKLNARPELTSENLRKTRARTGLSQSDFAAVLGLSASTIGQYERGDRRPCAATRVVLLLATYDFETILTVANKCGIITMESKLKNGMENQIS